MHFHCLGSRVFGAVSAGVLAVVATEVRADPVLAWNKALLEAARAARMNPPVFSRAAAIVHIAMADAANGVTRWHQPYHVAETAPPGASWDAAVLSAAYTAATGVITHADVQRTNFTVLYESSLAAIPDGPAKTEGVAWGRTVANAILQLRANDGASAVVTYTNAPAPGVWRPISNASPPALLPGWGKVTCFSLPAGSRLVPQPPPHLKSSAYAFEHDIVRRLGAKNSSERTAEQSLIAEFWADGPGTETPPGHWNHIAHDVAVDRGFSAQANARLFALLNIALADAAITCWDTKYTYALWRPITAIREAESDGNPSTVADPAWESFIATPPFPEYTSGHSTFSRSAARVLAEVFGADGIPFVSRSDSIQGVVRAFEGFSAAADESGISRIYGGIHWPSANVAGQTLGHVIGGHVMEYLLLPLTSSHFATIRREGGNVQLTIAVEPNRPYRIEASSDLKAWETLATVNVPTTTATFVDTTTASGRIRFYRAVAQ